MKFLLTALFFVSMVAIGQIKSDKNVEIGILGMFHLGNTSDMAAVKLDDLTSEKRQKEIELLVAKLKKFNPTKIMVEDAISSDSLLERRYQNYLAGKHKLGASETEQIGFRLAEVLGHEKIYGIDYKMEMPMENLIKYCQENNKMEAFQALAQSIYTFTAKETKKLKTMSLVSFIAEMNSNQYDQRFFDMYHKDLLAFGHTTNQAGITYILSWYERNMHIFKNMVDTIEPTDKRVLVIIGSNHRAGLKQYIEARSDMEYVEIGEYLNK